jgi:hypothetical protein
LKGFTHFAAVADALGVEDGVGRHAAVNAAHCLLRAGKFAEAEARFGSLESLFEHAGDYQGAARVWMSECLANWKRLKDPNIRHQLVSAIKMFEDAMPAGLDVMTRYVQKHFIEPAYLLLITANAHSSTRTDALIDETLSAAWALLSRDRLADLEPETVTDAWEAALARARRPLAATRTSLAPVPGMAVVHLISGIDCLVWMIYGFDHAGRFRFVCVAPPNEHATRLTDFLGVMHEHLADDGKGDALAVHGLEAELERLGSALAADLPDEWWDALEHMQRLVYLPHPFGSVDEFPISGLRRNGKWLGDIMTITRSPSLNHLREMLSDNRATVLSNRAAVVVMGAPDLGGQRLINIERASTVATETLNALGFQADTSRDGGTGEMAGWLDGGVGALHYIGHGIANEVMEALPLASGEDFGPLDADQLDGFRVPFLFFCACVAARIRAGSGGYQTGLASKLVERGGPAALAFSMPVVEERAYALARTFYRAARTMPFGEAVRATLGDTQIPAYVRLALTAYGDPAFQLTSMIGVGPVVTLQSELATWESRLRHHCVLRTTETESALRATLPTVPAALADGVRTWANRALKQDVTPASEWLDQLETLALTADGISDSARLSVRAAVCAERLHTSGIEVAPIVIPTDPTSIRQLLACARFLAFLGGALFDMRLNGLGNSLMGRIITIDQNDARAAEVFLRQGREKLLECEGESPFVRGLRAIDAKLLEHYGLSA